MNIWPEPQSGSLFAAIGDLEVRYARTGPKPTAVPLHGSASCLHHFEGVTALLPSSYDVGRRGGCIGHVATEGFLTSTRTAVHAMTAAAGSRTVSEASLTTGTVG
ncbi:hypothetical protein OG226_41735 [Streptomyces sp. NBC_01261]|uniref:hypothetical protein n=1 Tax=Streptomyces sp. NBC_01261 TaxID=2903802 RepID=UPI002E38239D|nr:hypothetical protein [Streptomyces sp. NBC_01261]